MAEVILQNVSKTYDGINKAVQSVDLTVEDKEFVILVGPSGCGKSTTLRMIAGLEDISEGEIFIDNKKVNDVPPKDRDIAMVFQNYALYPHLTVFENMAFGLKIRKYDKKEIKQRVAEAAKILDIENLLNRKPKALSGGQRQRVAVGRAIVRKPKVFLFDEPLSNLDAKLRVQMRTEISKLHKKLDATMVYVTHDQTEAMTMGDRIVVMKDGFVHQIDSPLNLYNNPVNKFVASFIGSPSMNFIEGEITKREKLLFKSLHNSIEFNIPSKYASRFNSMTDSKVILGFRPEEISLIPNDFESAITLNAKLEVIEPMGNEIFIYFTLDNQQITGRISLAKVPKAGEEVELFINSENLHFFDSKTESRLTRSNE
ncbi:MAG: sn-glycerol-3-phosphate ABC transporter ATP-binding protein UgpC [Bacteroidetes bacterium]|nr:sn-glycerol-3-phosphate ABC transporter ATP-binding protein UgpC [Bacteroidota bacterium]MBU1677236.1 sn-glycerol-3-phosphate ABC transporter ATP-binding protein UgpC [Bacteroidota bacterium]MBU2505258.1 sn-glycerol-3-phosphate ABC transporter ATP-binding protein UgpC [Bacteroidota bacterium]